MEREYFTFHTTWLEGMEGFTKEEQGAIALALLRYCAYREEPDLSKPYIKMAFLFNKHTMDKDIQMYLNGKKEKKAQAEPKQTTSRVKANNKQNQSKQQAETNQEQEIEEQPDTLELFAEEDTPREKTRYELYREWLTQNAPFIVKNFKNTLTEEEFNRLIEKYDSELISDTILQIENRKDLRKRYTNLNLTLQNWLKKDEYRANK